MRMPLNMPQLRLDFISGKKQLPHRFSPWLIEPSMQSLQAVLCSLAQMSSSAPNIREGRLDPYYSDHNFEVLHRPLRVR